MHLDAAAFEKILTDALGAGEYADAFYERRVNRSFRLQDGKIHEAGLVVSRGVGIRALSGECTGYAYSDDLSEEALLHAARVAALIARDRAAKVSIVRIVGEPAQAHSVYDAADELSANGQSATYVDLLARADVAARAYDPRVRAVNATLSEESQEVVVATSEGRYVRDRRPLVSLAVQSVAHGAARGTGMFGDGGRTDIGYFTRRSPEEIARESARIACVNTEAIEAPAGEMEVVVGAGSGGVLLHEAVGHGLEGDFNRQGRSLYSGRVGERVASDLVTIFDDGDLPDERGSVAIDDEGVAGRHKVLVENGILRGYMQDRMNAGLMGVESTGSGRRESFRVPPQPRMCNTYMPGGSSTPEEIVGSIERGLYATSFSGGQVEIAKGDFVFMIAEGYLIEGGRITAPVRGATLVGNGPDAMTKVTMVGNDARMANRSYTCGKGGQRVPVGVGIPTVKLATCTVGGTAR